MAKLVGHPGVGPAGPTSQVWTTPWPHRPGEKARDLDGNEYVFCEFITTAVGDGCLVSITPFHKAAPLLRADVFATRVGVARPGVVSPGLHAGWVQIYGVSAVWTKGEGTDSTDATSLYTDGTSTSEIDILGAVPVPQIAVTSPSGAVHLLQAWTTGTTLTSLVSNINESHDAIIIRGMFMLSAAQVSNLPDRVFTERYPNTTSPVSAVSDTSGPVTLTTMVSNASDAAIHLGGEMFFFLNYPYLEGVKTT